jgi:hypothetical protein
LNAYRLRTLTVIDVPEDPTSGKPAFLFLWSRISPLSSFVYLGIWFSMHLKIVLKCFWYHTRFISNFDVNQTA